MRPHDEQPQRVHGVKLGHGSRLVMRPECNLHAPVGFAHALLRGEEHSGVRYNLTFRVMVASS